MRAAPKEQPKTTEAIATELIGGTTLLFCIQVVELGTLKGRLRCRGCGRDGRAVVSDGSTRSWPRISRARTQTGRFRQGNSFFLAQTARPVKISGLSVQEVRGRILGDVAIIHRTSCTTADGGQRNGRYTDVWARWDGKWLAVSAHVTR